MAAGGVARKAVSDKQVSSRNRSRAVIVGASPCARPKVEQASWPPGRLGVRGEQFGTHIVRTFLLPVILGC